MSRQYLLMKIWIWIVVVVVVLIAAYFLLAGTSAPTEELPAESAAVVDDLNATANVGNIVVEEVVVDEVAE